MNKIAFGTQKVKTPYDNDYSEDMENDGTEKDFQEPIYEDPTRQGITDIDYDACEKPHVR